MVPWERDICDWPSRNTCDTTISNGTIRVWRIHWSMATHRPWPEAIRLVVGSGSADCSNSTTEKPHEWLRRNIGIRREAGARLVKNTAEDGAASVCNFGKSTKRRRNSATNHFIPGTSSRRSSALLSDSSALQAARSVNCREAPIGGHPPSHGSSEPGPAVGPWISSHWKRSSRNLRRSTTCP